MMMMSFTSLALAIVIGSVPNTTAQPNLSATADSEAVLTVEAINKLATFWSSFMKEPDSIKVTGRQANQARLTLHVGQEKQGAEMLSITAMAAKYPLVAADLKKAGLTAKQWEDYRGALYSAWLTKQAGSTVSVTSGLGKNVAFLGAHDKEINTLRATGMFFPTLLQGGGGDMGGGNDMNHVGYGGLYDERT